MIAELCASLRDDPAYDLFLQEGKYPLVRRHGQLHPVADRPLTRDEMAEFRAACGVPDDRNDFDTSYTAADGTRYRASLYRHLGRHGAVLRKLKTSIPPMDELGLPAELLVSWAARKAGLILITGPTGSGKSTSMASLLDWINGHVSKHVITIEDPIEYLFQDNACLFSQREVGMDTESYLYGLRQALRQSPDVIMLGEIRDAATAATTLQACETGHLVVATLHSGSAVEAMERFTRLFPTEERDGVNMVLASQLIGILSQRLLPGTDGALHLACESLENQGVSRRYIQENRWRELADLILRDDNPANRSLLRALVDLLRAGVIDEEAARQQLPNPQDLQRVMKGITTSGGGGR